MVYADDLELSTEVRVGATLCGKYRVDSVLGVGGMATVYAATHRNGVELALKVLHPELAARPSLRSRFLRGAYAANVLKHRGVLRILDDDVTEEGAPFLVMERLRGRTADELCATGKRLGVRAAVAIVEQVLDTLACAHAAGVVHRDIKPANIFVTLDGEVKVLDFGIARMRDGVPIDLARTGAAVILGTPIYMAPEQALAGMEEVDEQSDVWSVGATLFTLLSGRTVHEGETGAEILVRAALERARSLECVAPRTPRAIREVVDCALAFEKRGRWQNAAEMRGALLAAYRLHFGQAPSRAHLARLVDGTLPTVAKHVAYAPTEVTTKVRDEGSGEATRRTSAPCAVSAGPSPRVRASQRRWRVGGAVVAAAATIGWMATSSGRGGTTMDAPWPPEPPPTAAGPRPESTDGALDDGDDGSWPALDSDVAEGSPPSP